MKPPSGNLERAQSLLGRIPFNNLLGVEVRRFHADGVTLSCTVKPELLNSHGSLHGGVAASLADVAVGVAIHHQLKGKRPVSTVELKVNYLRPVREGVLYARAHVLRIGSTLCVGRVDLTDGNYNAVGTAIVTYIFVDARGARNGHRPAERRVSRGNPEGS